MGQALNAVEQIATDLQKANLPEVIAHYDQLAKRATVAVDGVNDLQPGGTPAARCCGKSRCRSGDLSLNCGRVPSDSESPRPRGGGANKTLQKPVRPGQDK
jgi:hypothetical protein